MQESKNYFSNEPSSVKDLVIDYCGNKSTKSKVIILLEFPEQVKDCLEWFKEIKIEKKIVVLSPFAMNELDDIPFNIIEDYYDQKELYHLGISNYQKVENLCKTIDTKIQDSYQLLAKLNITHGLFSFYDLKVIYDAATIRIFQLSKLIDVEKPDFIFVYDTKKYPFGIYEKAPYLLFDNRESIYAQLLALEGWKAPIVILPVISQPDDLYAKKKNDRLALSTLKKKILWWLQRHPKLLDFAVNIENSGLKGFFSVLKGYIFANKNSPILLIGGGYNWEDCKSELQSMEIGPIVRVRNDLEYWMNHQMPMEKDFTALLVAWEELKVDNNFREFFLCNDIDFFIVVEKRLRFLIEFLIPACVNAYMETDGLLKNKNIKAVISSTLSTCIEHSEARAARNAHIPVITWQHGSYGFHESPIIIYTDIMNSDSHFVFGDGVVERYAVPSKRFGTQLVSIGSASLDKLPQKAKYVKLNTSKKVVLYVLVSTFYDNHLYISWQPAWSDNSIWRTQMAILDVLGQHDDYAVVIKTYSSPVHRENPISQRIKKNMFKNCQVISRNCRFIDLLPIADIIVIDFPSTPLLEALTTSKPIFLFTGHLRIDDKALELLKCRVYCHAGLEDFIKALNQFLSTGTIDINVDLNNKDFLKIYGTTSQEGTAAERAASELKRIINEFNQNKKASI